MDDPLDAILSSPELADLRTSAKATEVRTCVLDGRCFLYRTASLSRCWGTKWTIRWTRYSRLPNWRTCGRAPRPPRCVIFFYMRLCTRFFCTGLLSERYVRAIDGRSVGCDTAVSRVGGPLDIRPDFFLRLKLSISIITRFSPATRHNLSNSAECVPQHIFGRLAKSFETLGKRLEIFRNKA